MRIEIKYAAPWLTINMGEVILSRFSDPLDELSSSSARILGP
jgi:hypothetical protein